MTLTAATLTTELKKIDPGTTEGPVRSGWAAAYTQYMLESTVLGISPASASVLATAEAAMDSTMAGISTEQTALVAAQLIVAAITSYWTAALTAGATVWLTTPFPLVAAPFTLPTALLAPTPLTQALEAVFTANVVGQVSKDDAYDAIVAVLHPAGAGATVTQATTPTPTPGIPVL